MPRASKEQAATHRAAVVDATAELLREKGVQGVTVGEACRRAGLTHGGFYKHFTSLDALITEALHLTLTRRRATRAALDAGADRTTARDRLVENYLSPKHRDGRAEGCAVSALVGDVPRRPPSELHAVYERGVEDVIDAMTEEGEPDALADAALMVGALVLARATAGTSRSDEFLSAARDRLIRRREPRRSD